MADLTRVQKSDLLEIVRKEFPDAEYAAFDSIQFEDSCGCYSEYTTESCSLHVEVVATLSEDRDREFEKRDDVNERAESWAKNNLSWSGCECCGDHLSVYVRICPKGK